MLTNREWDWIDLKTPLDWPLGLRGVAFPIKEISHISAAADPLFGGSKVIVFDWYRPRRLDLRPRTFERFLELDTDDSIVGFAKEFGALGLCAHGLPAHHPYLSSLGPNGRFTVKNDPDACRTLYSYRGKRRVIGESVAAWRAWARHARALLGVAAMLHAGKEAAPGNLSLLTEPQPPFKALFDGYPRVAREFQTAEPLEIVAWWTRAWLYLARVWVSAGFSKSGLSLELGAQSSLLGYVALSLGTAVTRTPGLAFCAGCQKPFFPKRLQSGRNSFCDKCGVRAAQRLAAKRYRDGLKNKPEELDNGKKARTK